MRRGVCQVVLHDDSSFLRRYHESRGDREIDVASWHAHPAIGEVREVKFLTRTKVTERLIFGLCHASAMSVNTGASPARLARCKTDQSVLRCPHWIMLHELLCQVRCAN